MDENINYRLVGVVSALILLALFLSACADNTPAPTQFSPSPLATSTAPAPTPTSAPTTSTGQSALPTTTSTRAVPTATTLPDTATVPNSPNLVRPTPTPANPNPTATIAAAGAGIGPVKVDKSLFLDDRSSPVEVLRSYYNAINLKQYVRAYSYWTTGGGNGQGQPQPYPQFEQGFANTASVELTIGQVTEGAAAGTSYYGAPVTLQATTSGGQSQTFVGCYVIRWPRAANFGTPPFRPMSIDAATVQQVAPGANPSQLMAQACQNSPGGNSNNPYTYAPVSGIDASQYLDDRSEPVQVVRSFYNAINRHEYVRAYSYWGSEVGSSNQLQPYPQFEQGYQATASVQITLGKASTQGAAGSIYTNQPVTIVARQVGGQNKTYVGCYVIRQVQPSLFGAPPFEPIRFYSAKIQEVQGNADTQALMNSACNQ